jgi:hypothetical protein
LEGHVRGSSRGVARRGRVQWDSTAQLTGTRPHTHTHTHTHRPKHASEARCELVDDGAVVRVLLECLVRAHQ